MSIKRCTYVQKPTYMYTVSKKKTKQLYMCVPSCVREVVRHQTDGVDGIDEHLKVGATDEPRRVPVTIRRAGASCGV